MPDSPIVELRQYTLFPGRRDRLIEIFERNFVESQEEVGMEIIGTFRDLDDPNRFVWLRGFPDLASRAGRLHDFYYGPVWGAHRDDANETMADSDDVLLLRCEWPRTGFPKPPGRAAFGVASPDRGIVEAVILSFGAPVGPELVATWKEHVVPVITASGGSPIAALVTEDGSNDFPALPVRNDHTLVWLAAFGDHDEYARLRDARIKALNASVRARFPGAVAQPHILRLEPTHRSSLDGRASTPQATYA